MSKAVTLLALAALMASCRTKSSVSASYHIADSEAHLSAHTTTQATEHHAEDLVVLLDSVVIEAIDYAQQGAGAAPSTPLRLRAQRMLLAKSGGTLSHVVQDSAADQTLKRHETSKDTTSVQAQPAYAACTRSKELALLLALAIAAIAAFCIKRKCFNAP